MTLAAHNPNAARAADAQARYIVAHDPAGSEGSVILQAEVGRVEARGGVVLPYRPELGERSGVGGYFKRAYGAGVPLHAVQSSPAARITLFCDPKYTKLHWAARLVVTPAWAERLKPTKERPHGDRLTGTVRMLPDGTQEAPLRCACQPQGQQWEARELVPGNLDEGLGVVVRGVSNVGVAQAGHYPFALYGFGDGIRVAWVAVSQA